MVLVLHHPLVDCWGGDFGGLQNLIQYITISSTGDAVDFGDLTDARNEIGGASNSTRGLFGGVALVQQK